MARYLKYQTDEGGVVLLEVEGSIPATEGGVVKAGRLGDKVQDVVDDVQTKFGDAMDTIRESTETIIAKVEGLSDRPDEVEVTFGLKATGELGGSFAVAKAGVDANYTVKMTWKRDPGDRERKPKKLPLRRKR